MKTIAVFVLLVGAPSLTRGRVCHFSVVFFMIFMFCRNIYISIDVLGYLYPLPGGRARCDWLRRSANRDIGDVTVDCGTVRGQVAICGMAPTTSLTGCISSVFKN
jgi:hypothetical protein